MESIFRIFELANVKGEICLKDIGLSNEELFRYQDDKGNFKDYAEAKKWLHGLSFLKGNHTIIEIFSK